jgi:flagellar M-ring protein FliF
MADAASLPTRSVLDTVPGLRQLVLLVGVAAAIAAAIWLVLWSQGPNYTLLYGELAERDAAAVVEALNAASIPNRVEAVTGGVLVPAERVHEARLKLAAQGLPQGDGLGVELLQKEQGFGTSQFIESARYQLALETELGRTIIKVQGVQSARVHLALPKQSVFVRDRRKASASVMLQLYPGRRLDPGQVAAIVHLVASSVPDLEASEVTVVDQAGTLLSSPETGDELDATARQLTYQRAVEESYEHRIEALLTPLVGAGRVRAGVTADLDFTVTERTSEDFDPAQQVVRSEQTSTDERLAGDTAQGVPGALSNTPPQASSAPPPARPPAGQPGQQPLAQAPPQPVATQQRATRNFEIDRTISHTRPATGTVRRLSVAVILDNKPAAAAAEGEGEAQPASQPYSKEELERFTTVVKEAVGFDEQRGDRVQVLNESFSQAPVVAPVEAPPMWQSPAVAGIARQALGAGLVLLVAFMVLRPLMKSLTRPTVGLPVAAGAAGMPELAGDRVTLGAGPGGGFTPNYEQQVAAARSLVGQDPRRAAEVVREWVTTDGR